MRTDEIRRRFLSHFTDRGHTLVPSASLIADDPTLLLVNAGMVPFKPYFLGEAPPPYARATSVQKCVRTLDIDEVGKTTRHGSFFQMCGNFSFGDYFKAGAIDLAWELITKSAADGGFGFAERDLWVTVYHDDDEAESLWTQTVGVDPSRVVRRGMKDNFWSMGVPGPCGPCSEIYVDRGPAFGPDGGPEADEDRYLEIWNLVFMQFARGPGAGKEDYPILGDLPARNIDTGLGLERVAYLLQGVDNLYEIDQVRPVLDAAAELAGLRYGADPTADVRLRVIADHVRSALMIIGDGVIPANEGRGYVLRRMMRRAVRALRLLGVNGPGLPTLLPVARDAMAPSYPELASDYPRIASYAYAEEAAFLDTLRAGTTMLDTAVARARTAGVSRLSGGEAFTLHDTHGFPIDLTVEMAAEAGLDVDEDAFRRLMAEQRDRARADNRAKKTGAVDSGALRAAAAAAGPTTFTGYTELARESAVRALLGADGHAVAAAAQGSDVSVILDVTPFYAEAGGQQADTGRLVFSGGELEVFDVQRPLPDLVVHRARVLSGELPAGATVWVEVDSERRRAVSRAHTATHLVHTALRRALGDSATQAGSLNAPGRLRFDFASPGAVPPSVLGDVEDEVNAVLLDDHEVRAYQTTLAAARASGAMALFGEKYGDEVRVVEVGDYARELCGGTHVARSAQLGAVKLLGEASIGAGVRRVEALVGLDAFRFLAREHVLLSQLAGLLKVPSEELPDRLSEVLGRLRDAERDLVKVRSDAALAAAPALAAAATDVEGVAVVAHVAEPGTAADDLRRLVTDVRARLGGRPAVVVVAAASGPEDGARVALVVGTNEAARSRGARAGVLARELSSRLGGGGGGKDDLAQGGGTDTGALPAAVGEVPALVRDAVSGA